jgi:gluconokinase
MPHANAIVVIGVAGSGKSTVALGLAGHYGYVFLDADDFHADDAKVQMAAGVPLMDAQREPWVAELGRQLQALASRGSSSVLAFSGLRAVHRQRLRECGVPMRFVYLDAPPSTVAGRLESRLGHFMPAALTYAPPRSESSVATRRSRPAMSTGLLTCASNPASRLRSTSVSRA